MPLLRRPLLTTVLAIAMAGAWAIAWAGPSQERGREAQGRDARESRQDQQGQRSRNDDALSDSVRRIERSTRAQVLSAERMQSDGHDVNRIKVVDDRGRVRVYMDDPQQPSPPPTHDDDD